MYYKKLLKKTILKKYWVFFCGKTLGVFKINYMFLNAVYSSRFIIDIRLLIFSIKRLIPCVASIIKTKNDFLFIGTRFLYSKTISNYNFLTHQLTSGNPGIFSNFSITSFYTMNNIALKVLPKAIFFFNLEKNDYLLKEAKNKNIPIISLVSSKNNGALIDYPIIVDTCYFYTFYFFNLFFFRFLRLN